MVPAFDVFTNWGLSWFASSKSDFEEEAPKPVAEQPANDELEVKANFCCCQILNPSQKAKDADPDPLVTEVDRSFTIANVMTHVLEPYMTGPAGKSLVGIPFAILALQKEIHCWRSIPKEDSCIKKVLLFPALPTIAGLIFPIFGLLQRTLGTYEIARNAIGKLKKAWERFKKDPMATLMNPSETIEALAFHITNLAIEARRVKKGHGREIFSGLGNALEAVTQSIMERLPRRGNWWTATCPKPFSPFEASNRTFTDCRPIAKVNMPCDECGMFSVHMYLLGVLDLFEQGKYSGIEVDFGDRGVYYSPSRGPNYFEDFYCPLKIRDPRCPDSYKVSFSDREYGDICNVVEGVWGHESTGGLSRTRARELMEKYLILRPEIQREIDAFDAVHFSNDRVREGLHFRGTDKTCNSGYCEARRVSYDEMAEAVRTNLQQLALKYPDRQTDIFAISDEQPFIDHLERQFPGQVIVSPAKRSSNGKPLHLNVPDVYKSGKEALIDAFLLAKSHAITRTSSNLGRFVSMIVKDNVEIDEVSKRFYQDRQIYQDKQIQY